MSDALVSHRRTGVRSVRPFGRFLRQDRGWIVAVALVIMVTLAPVVSLVAIALSGGGADWPHLVRNVLPPALLDTAILFVGVGVLVSTIGVTTAWLVSAHEFPGRRLFEWALLLPLAVPTYIVAYSMVELLDYFGPVQAGLRALFGFTSSRDYWFPSLRSTGGAIFLMGFVLYPYVYLTARAMFLMQTAEAIEAARTLGATPWRAFLTVALPLARPAIVVGTTLALLEALNDIGAVEYLGVRTLTVSIYTTWLNRGSLEGAAQIALLALVVVMGLIFLESRARRGQRYAGQAQRQRRLAPVRLDGFAAAGAVAACALPVLAGFVAPAGFLAVEAVKRLDDTGIPAEFWSALTHTLLLALAAVVATISAGLVVAGAIRMGRTPGLATAARVVGVGYAVPGTVLAVGLLAPLAAFDNAVDALMRAQFGIATGLILSGSGAALVIAYVARFTAITAGGLEAGLQKISPHLEMAARNLGRGPLRVVREIHLPLLWPAFGAAALLVFVDTMKELPATLLLRPFNFETLATLVYGQASRGAFEEGALAALAIVLAGLGPVILLARLSRPVLPELARVP